MLLLLFLLALVFLLGLWIGSLLNRKRSAQVVPPHVGSPSESKELQANLPEEASAAASVPDAALAVPRIGAPPGVPIKPPIALDPGKPPIVVDPVKPPVAIDPTKPPIIDPTKPPVVIDPTRPPIVVDPPVKRDPGCPPLQIEDRYIPQQFASTLATHLSGTPADGSRAATGAPQGPVVWVDRGDEVLVHLESTQVRMQDGCLIVSVDFETDQTGRQPLVMAFSVSNTADASGLIATTDDLPRGNGLLAARWGHQVQSAVWASILNMARVHASERQLAPNGISVIGGVLQFQAGAPAVAVAPTVVLR